MNLLLFSALLGFLTFILIVNVYNVRAPQELVVQRRLDEIRRKTAQTSSSASVDPGELAQFSNDFKFKVLAKHLRNFKITDYVKNMLFLAGANFKVDSFILLCFLCTLPLILILLLTSPKLALIGLVGFFIPFAFLKLQIDRRASTFNQQFPDALDLLASSLRAGHSLYSGFEVIVNEMPQPVSGVFKNTVDEIAFGMDTKDAIISLTKIMPSSVDLRFFTTAVLLQREVGGNLARILDGLSQTIRERFKMLGQLRAQTAQARLSGAMLSIVPPAITGILFIVSPDYMEPLLYTENGNYALALSVCLLLIGIYVMKRTSTIEI